jgi:hypothetical protein
MLEAPCGPSCRWVNDVHRGGIKVKAGHLFRHELGAEEHRHGENQCLRTRATPILRLCSQPHTALRCSLRWLTRHAGADPWRRHMTTSTAQQELQDGRPELTPSTGSGSAPTVRRIRWNQRSASPVLQTTPLLRPSSTLGVNAVATRCSQTPNTRANTCSRPVMCRVVVHALQMLTSSSLRLPNVSSVTRGALPSVDTLQS